MMPESIDVAAWVATNPGACVAAPRSRYPVVQVEGSRFYSQEPVLPNGERASVRFRSGAEESGFVAAEVLCTIVAWRRRWETDDGAWAPWTEYERLGGQRTSRTQALLAVSGGAFVVTARGYQGRSLYGAVESVAREQVRYRKDGRMPPPWLWLVRLSIGEPEPAGRGEYRPILSAIVGTVNQDEAPRMHAIADGAIDWRKEWEQRRA
jgi:hypothetical protein